MSTIGWYGIELGTSDAATRKWLSIATRGLKSSAYDRTEYCQLLRPLLSLIHGGSECRRLFHVGTIARVQTDTNTYRRNKRTAVVTTGAKGLDDALGR